MASTDEFCDEGDPTERARRRPLGCVTISVTPWDGPRGCTIVLQTAARAEALQAAVLQALLPYGLVEGLEWSEVQSGAVLPAEGRAAVAIRA